MDITVYSKPNCSYCEKAKALLISKQLNYTLVELDVGQVKLEDVKYISRDALIARMPLAKTMPQIVIDGVAIGGFQELQKRLI